jgi:hypothetical protein
MPRLRGKCLQAFPLNVIITVRVIGWAQAFGGSGRGPRLVSMAGLRPWDLEGQGFEPARRPKPRFLIFYYMPESAPRSN